jgi:hypothetical protein
MPIMSGQLNRFWNEKPKWILGSFFGFALLLLFLFCFEPASPDGVYYDPYLACGHGLWTFKDGQVFIQCPGEPPSPLCTYGKVGGQWRYGNSTTNQVFLVPSLFGIKLIGSGLQNGQVFWPRDCFSWVIDSKEWLQHHFSP